MVSQDKEAQSLRSFCMHSGEAQSAPTSGKNKFHSLPWCTSPTPQAAVGGSGVAMITNLLFGTLLSVIHRYKDCYYDTSPHKHTSSGWKGVSCMPRVAVQSHSQSESKHTSHNTLRNKFSSWCKMGAEMWGSYRILLTAIKNKHVD